MKREGKVSILLNNVDNTSNLDEYLKNFSKYVIFTNGTIKHP